MKKKSFGIRCAVCVDLVQVRPVPFMVSLVYV